MPEVMEFYRMAGDVDYMLRVVVADMQTYDAFYKQLIDTIPLKNVTSRFAMERIKSVTALPVPAAAGNASALSRRSPPARSRVAGGVLSTAIGTGQTAHHLYQRLMGFATLNPSYNSGWER